MLQRFVPFLSMFLNVFSLVHHENKEESSTVTVVRYFTRLALLPEFECLTKLWKWFTRYELDHTRPTPLGYSSVHRCLHLSTKKHHNRSVSPSLLWNVRQDESNTQAQTRTVQRGQHVTWGWRGKTRFTQFCLPSGQSASRQSSSGGGGGSPRPPQIAPDVPRLRILPGFAL